jgi:phage portal protein BeeE
VLNDIDAARYSAEWNRNFFINGARPGGIIEVDYRMEDREFNEFIQRWRQQHQGVANAHRVAVLENAKWVETNFSMTDMQFIELRNLPRELIREAFAFPKPMLGTVDDVNRANSDAGKEILAENHTIPRLSRWKDTINTFLLPQFANGKTLELDYDDPTPVNHEAMDRERNSQTAGAQKLVLAGYDPDDVTDAMGLPRMRWVGIPVPAYETEEEGDENTDQAPVTPQSVRRNKARV